MMTLLSPAGLWTLAALALPLAIHLWRRPPRTVRLGSLRFLQSRPGRLQNLRWREQALLLSRLTLLALLALLLAHPIWHRSPPARPPRWALFDPAAAPAGPTLDRLRALQSDGVETRLLAPGFPTVQTPPADSSAPAPDLWSLLREADAMLPAGSSLAVFSPGHLASLRGLRPALAHSRVVWIDTPAAPTLPATFPAPIPPTPALNLLVLHDADRAEDARYVAAALRAISRTDKRPLAVSIASTDTPASAADWIFWLSARLIPPAVAARTTHLFNDAETAATADATPGWIIPQPNTPGAAAFIPPVRLWQRIPPVAGSVVWTDGFGQPLLTRTDDAHGTRWHFASRFLPAWNDLPLGTALPASLRALLNFSRAEPSVDSDPRLADPAQCPPADAPTTAVAKLAPPGAETDLRQPLWLLAAGLFGLERFLSHRCSPRAPVATTIAPAVEPALTR